MRRIVIDPTAPRPQLPSYEQIDHPAIRDAAAAWDAAKAAKESARRNVIEFEQTRDAAEWEDAKVAEEARAARKPEPKARSHVAEHDRKTDAARHELKIATLAEQRALAELQAAIDEHQGDWAANVESDVAALNGEWGEAVNALVVLHARRSAALQRHSLVTGADVPPTGAIALRSPQIQGIDFAQGAGRQTGYVATGDVLALLADLGVLSEPIVIPQEHRPPMGSSPLRGMADVEREITERRELAARRPRPVIVGSDPED